MDGARFDALSRVLSDGTTRRRITRLLSGLALGGPIALRELADATAKKKHRKKKRKKKCKGGARKCGRKCIAATACCTTADCGEGGACVEGVCNCLSGFISCDGACVPDDECCPACEGDTVCDEGECVCGLGFQDCEGDCIPDDECCTSDDCAAGETCLSNGSCAMACSGDTCPAGCDCAPNTEGGLLCVQAVGSCEDVPQECTSTTECPLGQKCQRILCDPGNRCVPLCTA